MGNSTNQPSPRSLPERKLPKLLIATLSQHLFKSMDPTNPEPNDPTAFNRPPHPGSSAHSHLSTFTVQSSPKAPIPPSPWASQTTTFPASNSDSPSFPQFSAATAEILKRLQANQGNATGTPAFEAKRAEVLQNYVTSDKLPTPPPVANAGRRGRGGRVGTPSALKGEAGVSSTGSTPASGRGAGRGRGRGRGGGRGGKRKRADSLDSDVSGDFHLKMRHNSVLTYCRTTQIFLPRTHHYPHEQNPVAM